MQASPSPIDRNSWCSPQEIVDCLGRFWGAPDTDPCSNERSIVHARIRYALPQDGLALPWSGRVYCNPPYSNPGPWVTRCRDHARQAVLCGPPNEAIACVIADPSTKWWKAAIWRKDCNGTFCRLAMAVCFPDHRVRFLPPPGAKVSSMTRPVALPYWGHRPQEFDKAFAPLGKVVIL